MESADQSDRGLLQHFWDLAATKPDQRLQAAQGLLKALAEVCFIILLRCLM